MDRSKNDMATFRGLLSDLLSYYPGAKSRTVEQLTGAWYRQLERYDIKTITKAIDTMPIKSPDWFPSVGAVAAECRSIMGAAIQAEVDAAKAARQQADDRAYDSFLDSIPDDHAIQDDWVRGAPNDCERLGRQWTIRSKRQGRRADSVLDATEAKERFAALFAVIGGQ